MGSLSRRYIVRAHGGGPDTSHTSLTGAYRERAKLLEMGAVDVTIDHVPARRPINLLGGGTDG